MSNPVYYGAGISLFSTGLEASLSLPFGNALHLPRGTNENNFKKNLLAKDPTLRILQEEMTEKTGFVLVRRGEKEMYLFSFMPSCGLILSVEYVTEGDTIIFYEGKFQLVHSEIEKIGIISGTHILPMELQMPRDSE